MTVQDYWEEYDSIENPFDETYGSYQLDHALIKKIYCMEHRLRHLLSADSNVAYDDYTDGIFSPGTPFGVYMRQANDFLLSLLKAEATGANAEARLAQKLPPFTMTSDIEDFYRAHRAGLTCLEWFAWWLEYTEWFSIRSFIQRFPMKIRCLFMLVQVLALTVYCRLRGTR